MKTVTIQDFYNFNVIQKGHFLLTSGRHSEYYINKNKIFSNSVFYLYVIESLFQNLKHFDFDLIVGPPTAGSTMASTLIGFLHAKDTHIPLVYTDDINKKYVFKRGYDTIIQHKKVLIIEDIITTGGSVLKLMEAIQECKGYPTGVLSIWNRGNVNLSYNQSSLISKKIDSHLPEHCPLCKQNIPLTDPKQYVVKELKCEKINH